MPLELSPKLLQEPAEHDSYNLVSSLRDKPANGLIRTVREYGKQAKISPRMVAPERFFSTVSYREAILGCHRAPDPGVANLLPQVLEPLGGGVCGPSVRLRPGEGRWGPGTGR